jgi:uncharacterized protein YjiS (DUF1127 family)
MTTLDLTHPRISTHRVGFLTFARRVAEVRRQRAALRKLDDRALSDIGISRYEAEIEADRPVWDVPATWRD